MEGWDHDPRVVALIRFLTESHIDHHGGYQYDWAWIGDVLAIAALDDAKDRARTELQVYERGDLLAWVKRAERYTEEEDGGEPFDPDFATAVAAYIEEPSPRLYGEAYGETITTCFQETWPDVAD